MAVGRLLGQTAGLTVCTLSLYYFFVAWLQRLGDSSLLGHGHIFGRSPVESDSFTNKTPSKNLFVLLAKTKTRQDILISY